MTSKRSSLIPKNIKNPLFSTGIPNFPDEEFTQGVLLVPPPEQLLSQGGEVDRFLGQDVVEQAEDASHKLDSQHDLPPPPPSTLLPSYRTRPPFPPPPHIQPVSNPESEPDFKQIPLDDSVPLYNPSAVLWSSQRDDLNRPAPAPDTGVPLYDPSHVGSVLPPHATKRPQPNQKVSWPEGPTPAALDPAYSSLSKHISTCSPSLVIDSGPNPSQSGDSRKSSGSSSVQELHGFNSQPAQSLPSSIPSSSLHSLPQKTSHLLSQAYQSASNFSFFSSSLGSTDPSFTEAQTRGEKPSDSTYTPVDSSASFPAEQVPLYPVKVSNNSLGLHSSDSLITPSPVRYFPPPTGPVASSQPSSNVFPSAPPDSNQYPLLVSNPRVPVQQTPSHVNSVTNGVETVDKSGTVSTADFSSDYSISSFFNNLNPFKRGASPSVKTEVPSNTGANINGTPLSGSQSLDPIAVRFPPSLSTSSSSNSLSAVAPSSNPTSSPLPPPPLTGFQTSNTPLSSLPKIHHSFPSNPYSIHSQNKVQAPAFRPEHYFTPIPVAENSKLDSDQHTLLPNSEHQTSHFSQQNNFSPGTSSQNQDKQNSSPIVDPVKQASSIFPTSVQEVQLSQSPIGLPSTESALVRECAGAHPPNPVPLFSSESFGAINNSPLPSSSDPSQAAPCIKTNNSPLLSSVPVAPITSTPDSRQPPHVLNSGQSILPPPIQNPLNTSVNTNAYRITFPLKKRPVYAPVPDLGISTSSRLPVMSNDQNTLNNVIPPLVSSTSAQILPSQPHLETASPTHQVASAQSPPSSQLFSGQSTFPSQPPSSVPSLSPSLPVTSVQSPFASQSISSVRSSPSQPISSIQPPFSSPSIPLVQPHPPSQSIPSVLPYPPSQSIPTVQSHPLSHSVPSVQPHPPSHSVLSVQPHPPSQSIPTDQIPYFSQPIASVYPRPSFQNVSPVAPPPLTQPISSFQSPQSSLPPLLTSSVQPPPLSYPEDSSIQSPFPPQPVSSIPFQPVSVPLVQPPVSHPVSSVQFPTPPLAISSNQSSVSPHSIGHPFPPQPVQPSSVKSTVESISDRALPSIPVVSPFSQVSQILQNPPVCSNYFDPSAHAPMSTPDSSQAILPQISGMEKPETVISEIYESQQDDRAAPVGVGESFVAEVVSDSMSSVGVCNQLGSEVSENLVKQHDGTSSAEQGREAPPSDGDNGGSSQIGLVMAPSSPLTSFTPPLNQPFISMAVSQTYRPVYHHWFYRRGDEKKNQWNPFSMADSLNLEQEFTSDTKAEGKKVVATDGGRYDVDVEARKRRAVYWHEDEGDVRRCSWFVKGPVDSKYQPYDENIAALLEEEYKKACTRNEWNRRVELADGEVIIIHSPNSISHHQRSSSPDPWGNPPPMAEKPRVVKRGLDEFDIPEGEPTQVDHLLLLVHGIGKVCDLRFRSLVEVVDDFRSISVSLVGSHFRSAVERGKVGRVEVLPVEWHRALHTDAIDQRLADITLPSIPKARQFTNETLLDILFYTSPVFCERIVEAVGVEVNRVYSLYVERNPGYKGGVSLGGHSLGSLILFDMLCHQKPPHPKLSTTPSFSVDEGDEDVSSLGCLKTRAKLSRRMSYLTIGTAGTGQPYIIYPQLKFQPRAFFALGSPIGMFVTVRGIESLGEEFKFPTCPSFFNIFHPNDPVAYRIEGLINSDMAHHPAVLIPHHKGRKRMHLELKETMAHLTAAVKQKLLDSVKNTWNTVSSLTRFTRIDHATIENQVDKVLEDEILCKERSDDSASSVGDSADAEGIDVKVGVLNGGRRIDYVLQEAPLETFNQYISAVRSHLVYWESEDTMLLILKEIYGTKGITADCQVPQPILPFDLSAEANADPGTAYSHYTVSPSPAPSRQHTIAEEL